MGWIYVFIAGLFEIGFTISLKLSQNFSVLLPSLTFVVCAAASFGLLTQAIKFIPLGTAYAIWTGIGAFGTALAGIILFGESASGLRLALLAVLVCTIVALKFASPEKAQPNPEG